MIVLVVVSLICALGRLDRRSKQECHQALERLATAVAALEEAVRQTEMADPLPSLVREAKKKLQYAQGIAPANFYLARRWTGQALPVVAFAIAWIEVESAKDRGETLVAWDTIPHKERDGK